MKWANSLPYNNQSSPSTESIQSLFCLHPVPRNPIMYLSCPPAPWFLASVASLTFAVFFPTPASSPFCSFFLTIHFTSQSDSSLHTHRFLLHPLTVFLSPSLLNMTSRCKKKKRKLWMEVFHPVLGISQ
ncbi:hypothetical protein CDAR_275251 [Caerostris darwini]|uniref:Uncharacterized protein n=1 Tax=Caerostris darwini TaxID=1538125 RepID=A0AAV4VEZ8_9ARAC|nr:hypothetical protein CDAR_275251 [Caerostris darwini]